MIHTETVHREDGTIEHIDARTIDACRAFAIAELRRECTASILELAPEHTQRNAALGLLPAEEVAFIANAIQIRRHQFALLYAEIMAVSWDGEEASRATACNQILSVRWSNDP